MNWANLRTHRKAISVAAGLAIAFAVGRWSVDEPPAPAVSLREDTALQKAAETQAAVHDEKGAVETTTTVDEFAPPSEEVMPSAERQRMRGSNADRLGLSVAGGAAPESGHGPLVKRTVTVEKRGPEVIDSHASAQTHEDLQQHTSLTVTPAPPPRWALGAGIEDPLGSRRVNLFFGMRVIGPVWLRAGITPARGVPGATIGAEVQW